MANRETARLKLQTQKLIKLNQILEENAKTVTKSLNFFKYKNVDSGDLEQLQSYFSLEALAELANESDKYQDSPDSEHWPHTDDTGKQVTYKDFIDTIINHYVLYMKLKDVIKYGEFFDWKEEDELNDYVRKNLKKPYQYAYNAYPGGDGTAVVFSTVKLINCQEAIDKDEM